MAMTEQEREYIKAIVEGVSNRLSDQIKNLSIISDKENLNLCEKIEDLKKGFTQHDKRIVRLETSLAYQIGKVAGIASISGGLVSLIVFLVQSLIAR
jgi:hypothetical protein